MSVRNYITYLLTFLIGQPDVTNKSSAFCNKKAKTLCFTSSATWNLDILTQRNELTLTTTITRYSFN